MQQQFAETVGIWVGLGTLGLAIVLQAGAGMFFMGRLFERMATHNERLKKLEKAGEAEAATGNGLALAVGRLEEAMKHLAEDVRELRQRP